jgi:tetratricopeptide (TPR) repeat protein
MLAAAGLAATPAVADDIATCTASSAARVQPQARLQACERLIATGKYRGRALAPAYVYRAYAYSDLGDQDRALAEINEAIRLDPKLGEAYRRRGSIYYLKRDYDRAIADFEQAVRLDPKISADGLELSYRARAWVFFGKREFDRAISDFDRAIRHAPNSSAALMDRGAAYRARGDFDRAIADLDQAIRLSPQDSKTYALRAVAHAQKRDYDRAFADFDQALRLDPNSYTAFNNRGFVYNLMGQPDRALADLNEAIRLDPKAAASYRNRGLSYEAKGELDRALAEFRMALSLSPDNPDSQAGLARVTQRLAAATPASPSPAGPAPAGLSVRQLFERHQLIGTWAPDCGKPASAQNMYLVLRPLDDRRVQLDRMESPTVRNSAYAAETAVEPQPSELGVQVNGPTGPSALTFRVQAGQLMAFESWHRKCG